MEPERHAEGCNLLQAHRSGEAPGRVAGTASRSNEFGQPVGLDLAGWKSPPAPLPHELNGRYCQLQPLCEEAHGRSLFDAFAADARGVNWTYMPYGPFTAYADFSRWLGWACEATDPLFFAVVDMGSGRAAGFASYLNIDPANGSIEVGHIHYSEELKRTRAATEAMYLLMKHALRPRLSPLRVEVRRAQPAVARRGAASRVPLRRAVPQRRGLQRPHPRHPPGIRSSTASGRAWTPPFALGWPRPTSRADGHQRQSLSTLTAPYATDIVAVVGD